ncbi:MAG: 3'(2'),5'-bisphosphate nucleotidase CysQ [Brevundimonas sp.]|nr:MAG: 3'(2'),5'-bisphosphate nucleotidase CysQ [Brevundimonas sp.]
MSTLPPGLAADAELAVALADGAGRLLVALRDTGMFAGKALGKAGDAVAHQFLVHALAHLRPEDGVLSEEGAADPKRLSMSRVWIVDPVDGTREYGEARSDWAVHVALSIDGKAVIGAVAQPDLPATYSTIDCALGDCAGDLRILVSRTRPPEQAERAAAALGARLVGMGSAGAKTMAVVRGEAQAYVHAGGQYEWDSCAPVAVAAAAGLHVSRLDGSPLIYNRSDPYLPDIVVCRPELRDRLLAALR